MNPPSGMQSGVISCGVVLPQNGHGFSSFAGITTSMNHCANAIPCRGGYDAFFLHAFDKPRCAVEADAKMSLKLCNPYAGMLANKFNSLNVEVIIYFGCFHLASRSSVANACSSLI